LKDNPGAILNCNGKINSMRLNIGQNKNNPGVDEMMKKGSIIGLYNNVFWD
jgi:hypothetical protein